MNKSVVASVFTVAALCLAASGALAQSLQNASFETLVLGDGVAQRVNAYSLAGWDISKQPELAHSQVKVLNPSDSRPRLAPEGPNLAVITNGAELRQSFATVAGNAYNFSFPWDAKGQNGALKVLNGGGASSGSTLFETSLLANASGRLVSSTVGFVATGALSTIAFMAGTPLLNDTLRGGAAGSRLLVDGLQFATSVPEPSGSAMVLAGLGALGLMFRRRRLQG